MPGFGLVLTDRAGAGSWPIVQTTFILMPRQAPDAKAAAAARAFFAWVYEKGGPKAEKLDYVPLPASVIGIVKRFWKEEIAP